MEAQLKTFYKVAEVIIAIEGKDEYAAELRKYFEKEQIKNIDKKEDFLIQVNMDDEKNEGMEYFSLSGNIAFNEKEYRVKKKNFVYRVKNLFDKEETTILKIKWVKKSTIFNYILNHASPKGIGVYHNREKFVDSIMNYEVFWYIFAILLMKYNKVFVHCGIVAYKGKAIVMAGTGGCGKTSTLLEFLNKPECKYIAEDFGILDGNGKVWFTPKKAAIYQSDAKYKNGNIVNALKELSFDEKIFWSLFRIIGKNPRYRFSPYTLFEKVGICKNAELDEIIYLSRKNTQKISEHEIQKEQIIEKITNASFRELKELYEILSNIRAVGDEKIRKAYPALENIQNEYRNILNKAIKKECINLIELPLKTIPSDTVAHITK